MHPSVVWPAERQAQLPETPDMHRPEIHPCVAYPELYPQEGPSVGAGFVHSDASILLYGFIQSRLHDQGRENAFAIWDVFLYAAPKRWTIPDVMAYLDLRSDRQGARTFHLAFDGPPDLVLEILSSETWKKDVGVGDDVEDKKRYYQTIGVTEYWIYDPERWRTDKKCLFEGFRLSAGQYETIEPHAGRWYSRVLETEWEVGAIRSAARGRYRLMRLLNPDTGQWYPTPAEQKQALADKDQALADKDALIADLRRQLGAGTDAPPGAA